MRLSDLKENDKQLDEILPVVGAVAGGIARGAAALGGAALRGGAALAKGAGSAIRAGTQQIGKIAAQSGAVQGAGELMGLTGGGMDPAQAAQAAKEQQEQKKQVQDQIKQTEQQLADLRKQLAGLG